MQLFAWIKKKENGIIETVYLFMEEKTPKQTEGTYLTGNFSGGFGMLDFNGICS